MNFQKQIEEKVDMEAQEINADVIYCRHILRCYIMLTKLVDDASDYKKELDDLLFVGNIISKDELKRINKIQNVILNLSRTITALNFYINLALHDNLEFTDDCSAIVTKDTGAIMYSMTEEDLKDFGCTYKNKDDIDDIVNDITKNLNI